MHIEKIHIKNLRAAKDLEVSLGSTTALVGANGSGKSTILLALRVLFGKADLVDEDYHMGYTGEDIAITATFGGLGPAARGLFSRHVDEDGGLEVTCTVHWDGSSAVRSLHGTALQNPDFAAVRAEARDAVARPLYEELAGRPGYEDLPRAWPGIQGIDEALGRWEGSHPDRCTRMPDGGRFFGPDGAGWGLLSRLVRFLYITAARDASGEAGSGIGELLDITVREVITEKEEYRALPGKIKKACEDAMESSGSSETLRLGDALSQTLGSIVPDASVAILSRPPKPDIGKPTFDVYLTESQNPSHIAGAGDGLQRAFAIAVLHHLALARAGGGPDADGAGGRPTDSMPAKAALSRALGQPGSSGDDARDIPSVVLAMEEPEMHQHPTRMRHMASLLRSLPERGLAGASGPMQLVYTTHSPHFVFADRIEQVRRVSMVYDRASDPGVATVASTTRAGILEDMRRCGATRKSDGSVDYSLMGAMDPSASEGFFASAVVLVEGPSDRIVLTGAAEAAGTPLDALGISVVACGSKSTMPLPIVVFRRLGIPVYAVWDADSDEGRQRDESERIAKSLGHSGKELRGRICGRFACLEVDLEGALRSDLEKALGPADPSDPHYERILEERRSLHGIRKKDSKTLDAHLLMEEVRDRGIRLETINMIVQEIATLAEWGGREAEM